VQRELLDAAESAQGLGLLVDLVLQRRRQGAVDGDDAELRLIRMHRFFLPIGRRSGRTLPRAGGTIATVLEIGSAGLLAFGSIGSPRLPGEVILASGCLSTCAAVPDHSGGPPRNRTVFP